jgi:hypothetical protein
MLVQQYLRGLLADGLDPVAALNTLNETRGIKVKLYPEDNIVLLDYDQIESPKTDPLVIECRSLILNATTFEIVSKKFNRFFNFGEAPEQLEGFSFDTAVVFEKADGSLSSVYHNSSTNRWEVSTRGMAKAEGEHMFGGTFREKIISALGYDSEDAFQKQSAFIPGLSYIFEFCSPENRVVVRYDEPHTVLLGVCASELELSIETADEVARILREEHKINVRRPKMYDKGTSVDTMVDVANGLQNLEEGFVVYDPVSGKRIKIKSQTYLTAHRLRGNDAIPTRKNLLSLVLEGEVDEMLAYFPELKSQIDPIVEEVAAFEAALVQKYAEVRTIEVQKDFALAIQGFQGAGVLFSTRKAGGEPAHTFHQLPLNSKLKLFGI